MITSEIHNVSTRKFGDLIQVVYKADSGYSPEDSFTGRFVSATVYEDGLADVFLIPEENIDTVGVSTDDAILYTLTDETEWVPVQDDEPLENATVRFKHKITPSIVYAIEPLSHETPIGSGWEFSIAVCVGGSVVLVNDEYWTMEREVAVKPLYPMPTTPGLYTAANGDIWQHDPNAGWSQVWRNLTRQASGTADDARPFGPFTGPMVPGA